MRHLDDDLGRSEETVALFGLTFTASEGPEEGALIGKLAGDLLSTVPPTDLRVFTTLSDGRIVAAIVFTRLRYPQDDRTVFVLGPVAVATGHQRKGIGQALLRHGLEGLRETGVDVVLTYGDIGYYGRVGFARIPRSVAPPPLPLQHPEGWLGQSLTDRPLEPLRGPSTSVAPLNRPEFW